MSFSLYRFIGISCILCICLVHVVTAQNWVYGTNNLYIYPNTTFQKVGMSNGQSAEVTMMYNKLNYNPSTLLAVGGNIGLFYSGENGSNSQTRAIYTRTNIDQAGVPTAFGMGVGAWEGMVAGNNSTANPYGLNLWSLLWQNPSTHVYWQDQMSFHAGAYAWYTSTATTNPTQSVKMRMSVSGAVAIGNNAVPNENYKLIVDGKIGARSIVVTSGSWPDFVFKGDYILPTLNAVETHIKKNGTLPGVPSEKNVRAQGVDLGQMQTTLLQKVEELTLYVIEQNKKIEQLAKANNELNIKISGLRNRD
jgi:hypothetical protein